LIVDRSEHDDLTGRNIRIDIASHRQHLQQCRIAFDAVDAAGR
jgi:hypothetical protein